MVAKQKPVTLKAALERGPKPKFHKVETLSPAELEQREMEEYE